MRAPILLILLLGGCTTMPSTGCINPADPREEALLARYPDLVRREGNLLLVGARGGFLRHEDKDCAVDTDCAAYRLDEAFQDGRLFGIEIGYYEGGDYMVVDTLSGALHTGEKPLFSPGGHMFATAAFNENYETAAEGVRLYALDFPMRLVRTVSSAVLAYPENLAWRGDRCITFTAVEGSFIDEQGREKSRTTWYLVEDAPEWRLTQALDPLCRS
jgi:hypothetical protein